MDFYQQCMWYRIYIKRIGQTQPEHTPSLTWCVYRIGHSIVLSANVLPQSPISITRIHIYHPTHMQTPANRVSIYICRHIVRCGLSDWVMLIDLNLRAIRVVISGCTSIPLFHLIMLQTQIIDTTTSSRRLLWTPSLKWIFFTSHINLYI